MELNSLQRIRGLIQGTSLFLGWWLWLPAFDSVTSLSFVSGAKIPEQSRQVHLHPIRPGDRGYFMPILM
jgi:hypothetical protein